MNPAPQARSKVFVVGAGICGLTAAYRLQQAGFAVEVFEREPIVSGRVKSVRLASATIDTGATVFLPAYREAHALLRELGLESELQPVRGRIVFPRDGRMHSIDPAAPLKALFTQVIGWRSKLALIKLVVRYLRVRRKLNFLSLAGAQGEDRETLEDYCRRCFPSEVYQYVLNPAIKFLYLHNGSSGSLIELLWWLCAAGLGKPRSLKRGTCSLTDNLAEKLTVHTSAEVVEIARHGEGVALRVRNADGSEYLHDADACLVTVPGTIGAAICRDGLSTVQRDFLRSRRYDQCTVVSFVTRRRPPLDALMFMIPDEFDADLATVIFGHNIGAQRAPDGVGVINAYFMDQWAQRRAEADDETIVNAARASLRSWIPEIDDALAAHVQRWTHSAATAGVGDCARIAAFEAEVDPDSPIQVIGDFMAQASMNVAIATAEQASLRLIRWREEKQRGEMGRSLSSKTS